MYSAPPSPPTFGWGRRQTANLMAVSQRLMARLCAVSAARQSRDFTTLIQKAAAMVCRDGFLLSYPIRSTLPPTPSLRDAASCVKVLPRRPWLTRPVFSAAPFAFWGGGIGPDGAAILRSSILGLRSTPDTRPGITPPGKGGPSSPLLGMCIKQNGFVQQTWRLPRGGNYFIPGG